LAVSCLQNITKNDFVFLSAFIGGKNSFGFGK